MLDFNDIALFVSVMQAGSFAAAARRLGLPPNTISRRLQGLERQMGQRLLQRSTRRMVATEAGLTLFAKCGQQIENLAQSVQELRDDSEQPKGKIRFAAPADFFNLFSIDFIVEFLGLYPKVSLEFVLNDARADLLTEHIDVAFRTGKTLEPNLVARHIGWGSSALVASPAYLERRGAPASVDQLDVHECITSLTNGDGRINWHLDGPEGESRIEVKGRFHANSAQAQVGAAIAGLGIALLPTIMTARHVKSGQLLVVLPEYGLRGIGLYFVYLSRRHLPRAARALMDFTETKLREQGSLDARFVGGEPLKAVRHGAAAAGGVFADGDYAERRRGKIASVAGADFNTGRRAAAP